jgi:DNA helicase II / ATP-dependent DNA helicase PcrA
MAVGDDAQSIYSFRGANHENIMRFPDSFRNCRIIKLEENYRSTQPILSLTNEIIRHATYRYDKELFSSKPGSVFPAIVQAKSEQQQSLFVVQQVLELREQGLPFDEIAVLFRSGFHSFDLEIELGRANIPYQKFGGFKFIETAHVKDIIAHLRILTNPKDAVSWNRALLLLDGVGPRTAQQIVDAVVSGSVTLANTQNLGTITRADENVRKLFRLLNDLSNTNKPPGEQAWSVIEYYRPLLRKKYDDYKKRLKDVETFGGIAERYRSVNALLADMAIEPPTDSVDDIARAGSEDEFLTLSTIHSAKGLEWSVVIIIWALEGRFPPIRAYDSVDTLEEERRLFYVATTRAKERLYITHPVNIFDRESGSVLGKPTRFLDGIEDDLVERYVLAAED